MKTTENNMKDPFDASLEPCGCTQAKDETTLDRVSWRKFLSNFGSAATRIHRYRDLRTRMLRRALCSADCHYDADPSCVDE